uniref:Nuclear condensin complex subunit 3 C-terminal domain-containing protein n=1 Tax=Amphimedon queenslandica TaxID=400682 RepID=A0A1X7VDM6_AMPQE
MADNEDLHSQILKHLTEAQNGLHLHQKLIKSLNNLLVAEDETSPSSSPRVKQFFKAFLPMLRNSLLVLKREPAVERLIEFVAKFSVSVAMKKPARSEEDSSSDEEDEETDETLCQNDFFHILLYQLMEYLDAKEKSVRFRSCQLISKMFTFAFSDPSQESIRISSALSDSLADGLLERLKDRFQLVRLYAVSALGYLQDTSDAACIVTAAIIWSMTHDTSPEVRKCAIVNVLVTKISLPALIERTRDIKDLVRRAAFLKLSESVSIRNLTIDQRVQLANDGLRDESSKVKEAFTGGLLRNWYIELEDDLLQLLRRLDVENCPDVVELVLLSYFEELEDEDLVGSFEASLKRVAGEKEEEEEGGDTSTHISYGNFLKIAIT